MYRQNIRYEWDEIKRQCNLAKHGVDFSAVAQFEWDNAVITTNNRHGEVRFVAYGYIDNRLHVIVYTIRVDATRRIISIRRGNLREERYYAEAKAWNDFTDS